MPSDGKPQGIKYALCLHDEAGARLLAFYNAHGIPEVVEHDHVHPFRRIDHRVRYAFADADQLIADFISAVSTALAREGVSAVCVDEDMAPIEDTNDDEDA